tara:strand:- start:34457 stop:35119 length:663 start_codon:yes stop_codon:yes gene_type:complete
MQADKLISSTIIPLHPQDSGERAIELMNQFRINHLPVVRDNFFLGVISDREIEIWNSKKDYVEEHLHNLASPYVLSNQHLFDIIEVLEKNNLSIIPVLNKDQKYLGVIKAKKLLYSIAKSAVIQSPGAVIVLELNNRNYSMTEISNIIENNNIKILSSYITSNNDSSNIEVTIKLNSTELNAVIKDFERYGYTITESYKEDNSNINFLERYEQLMRFLDP